MASILLLGAAGLLQPFIASISSDHSLSIADAGGVRPLNGTGGETTSGFDIVCDLDYDRARIDERCEAMRPYLGEKTVVVMNGITMTATDFAARIGGRNATIGIGYVPHLYAASGLLETAPALQGSEEERRGAIERLREITGKEIEVVGDRVGLVAPRTLSMIVNEAAFALMEGVAGPEDIDVAMKLGTNYPEGPLGWADRIGPEIICAILDALYDEYREERYRPCVLLRQYVRAGISFHV